MHACCSWAHEDTYAQTRVCVLYLPCTPRSVACKQVAWLFNIRGSDILFNPVAIAAALLTQEDAFLFIDAAKLGEDVRQVKMSRGRVLLSLSRFVPTRFS